MRKYLTTTAAILLSVIFAGCSAFARRDRSADQIAAETALLGKKTALLERENQVLREENLALVRDAEVQKSEQQKKQTEYATELERLGAQLKAAEKSIANLTEKMGILESESGGKIKQLAALNEQLASKSADELLRAKEALAHTQLQAAQEKERLTKESAEKQFALGKEIQDLKQRLAEREKESDDLRKQIAELRAAEASLVQQLNELRARLGAVPGSK